MKKPAVLVHDQKKRLRWAKECIHKPSDFWHRVVFSDEMRIRLFGNYGRVRVWRRLRTGAAPSTHRSDRRNVDLGLHARCQLGSINPGGRKPHSDATFLSLIISYFESGTSTDPDSVFQHDNASCDTSRRILLGALLSVEPKLKDEIDLDNLGHKGKIKSLGLDPSLPDALKGFPEDAWWLLILYFWELNNVQDNNQRWQNIVQVMHVMSTEVPQSGTTAIDIWFHLPGQIPRPTWMEGLMKMVSGLEKSCADFVNFLMQLPSSEARIEACVTVASAMEANCFQLNMEDVKQSMHEVIQGLCERKLSLDIDGLLIDLSVGAFCLSKQENGLDDLIDFTSTQKESTLIDGLILLFKYLGSKQAPQKAQRVPVFLIVGLTLMAVALISIASGALLYQTRSARRRRQVLSNNMAAVNATL